MIPPVVPSHRAGRSRAGRLLLPLFVVAVPALVRAQAVVGKVTEAGGAPLVGVTVRVEGTQLGAVTREDGTYRIGQAPPGARTIVARRVGFSAQRRAVTIASSDVTVDFELTAAATSLEGVVSTATGEQRKIELGNSLGVVDASSRADQAPVKNVGDLLTAQMTGVQVNDATMTGGSSRIRIRGQNSMALANNPIFIIDGVRMTDFSGGAGDGGGTVPSRVNDIDPDEIENIEVVKGPSAATLYGTDAANGVIVITTKRGKAGRAAWSFHGEQGRIQDRNNYLAGYNIFGHTTTSPKSVTCFTYQIADKTCLLDSTVSLNIFKDPNLTPLKLGARQMLGGQVSGGSEALRYFLSGDMNSETGPLGIPTAFEQQFRDQSVPLPLNVRRPEGLQQLSVRSNLNASITPKLDVSVSGGLTNIVQRFPQSGLTGNYSLTEYAEWNPGYNDGRIDAYGNPMYGYIGINPGRIFQIVSQQTARRFIGSGTANWRPLSWLQARGDIGYDLTAEADYRLSRAGESVPTNPGNVSDSRVNLVTFTNNYGATATWQARSWAQLKSTAGAQFVMRVNTTVTASGSNLPPGGEAPSQASVQSNSSTTDPSKTLGAFIEEQLALRDRLFVTGAVRTDKNSAFGVNYGNAFYPKASLSWLLSDESFFPHVNGLDQLRLRASYGASGVQPGGTSALRTYNATNLVASGVVTTALTAGSPGNANLKPERSAEFEGGIDARVIGGRANLELTYYRKQTTDALITQPVAPSAGVGSFLANLGGVRNTGFEYRLQTQLVDRHSVGVDASLGGSYNQNKITSLGGFSTTPSAANQVGYPINSQFLRTISWDDANGDGLLQVSEVTLGSATDLHYGGTPLAPQHMTLGAGVEFLDRRLRISALADRQLGGAQPNNELATPCLPGFSCIDQRTLNQPLWRQARGLVARVINPNYASQAYVESNDYTRLREISATYQVADQYARRVGAKTLQITASARNIKLWTKWTGSDPETAEANTGDVPSTAGGAIGPPLYYMLRVNFGF